MSAKTETRRELTAIGALAIPIALSLLQRSGMAVTDTMIVARHSALDLGAVGLGSALWLSIFALVSGTLLIAAPLVSARHGAGETAEIGNEASQLLWFGLGVGVAGTLILNILALLLPFADVQPDLAERAATYLVIASLAMPGAALFQAGRYVSEGLRILSIPTLIATAGFVLNIALCFLLVHGVAGGKGWGAAGCATSTVVISWLMAAAMAASLRRSPRYRDYSLFRLAPFDAAVQRRLVRMGLPVGVMLFLEVGIFGFVALGAGRVGPEAAGAHQIAISIANLLFMMPLALSLALAIRIAHLRGAGDEAAARQSGLLGIGFCTVLSLVSAVTLMSAAPLVAHYAAGDPDIARTAERLLWFAAILQLADSVQVAYAGVLRGFGDTFRPMLITVVSYWVIGAPLAFWLGFAGPRLGLTGLWIGLIVGLVVAALALDWRSRSVMRGRSVVGSVALAGK